MSMIRKLPSSWSNICGLGLEPTLKVESREWLIVTNTLAYYDTKLITAIKSFIVQALSWRYIIFSFLESTPAQ